MDEPEKHNIKDWKKVLNRVNKNIKSGCKELICIENKNVYTFFCSERQLEIYLKEFGAEAKVISPLSLKNKLKDYYLKASNLYNQEDYNN